jgi:hypothetical protein
MSETVDMRPQSTAAPAPTTNVPEAAHGPNWLKWSLGCAGVGMLLFTGVVMVVLIVLPIAFRSLLPEQQYEVVKHAPFMASFLPTRAYASDTLPTAPSVNSSAAMALLALNPTATPTLPPTVKPTNPPVVMTSVLVTATAASASNAQSAPPTATAFPSPTGLPTDIPPTDIPATLTEAPIDSVVHLSGFKRVPQGWNDCGPANTTQALQYYGWSGTENDSVAALHPSHEDRNVSPWEIVRFVNDHTGVKAISRVAGDLHLIKRLVMAKFAVIMETGYIVAGEGWAGHYLTVLGYDDSQGILFGGDTNLGFGADGLGQRETYDDLDARWQEFNRRYIVVYTHDRDAELAGILGPDADPTYNKQHALNVAKDEAKARPDNKFAWFNIGSSLTMLGNYKDATVAFDQSRNTGGGWDFRMLWYQFTPYAAYYNSGDYNEVLALAGATLGTTPFVEETWFWRGMVEAATGNSDAATKDFGDVIKFNPGFTPAADALARVKNGNFDSAIPEVGGL